MCAGFVYSQVLYACVQLKLFDHLAREPMTIGALATALQLPLESTRRLIDAATALHLTARSMTNGSVWVSTGRPS